MRHDAAGAIRRHCLGIETGIFGRIRLKNRWGFEFSHQHTFLGHMNITNQTDGTATQGAWDINAPGGILDQPFRFRLILQACRIDYKS